MPIYLWYEGIDGPVRRRGKKWIELSSAQVGVNRNVTNPAGKGTNRQAAAPPPAEIVVTKLLDDTSTALFRESLYGAGKKVILEFVKLDRNGKEESPYMTVELENTLLSSYSTSGSGGDANGSPMESFVLNCVRMTFSTAATGRTPDAARPERAAWDLATMKGG